MGISGLPSAGRENYYVPYFGPALCGQTAASCRAGGGSGHQEAKARQCYNPSRMAPAIMPATVNRLLSDRSVVGLARDRTLTAETRVRLEWVGSTRDKDAGLG